MQTLEIDGQQIRATYFNGKTDLMDNHPEIYPHIKDSVFREFDPMMSEWAGRSTGWIFHDNITLAHPEDIETSSSFERIYVTMDNQGFSSEFDWVIFAGNVECEQSLALLDRDYKVVILGNLTSPGVSNDWGQLFVYGDTKITGTLYFDSDNGGFTQLKLVEPVGLIAMRANMFNVNLKSRHFCNPGFQCGFGNPPTNQHEVNVQAAFATADAPPKLIDIDTLASFFTEFGDDIVNEVKNGGHFEMIKSAMFDLHPNSLSEYFDSL